MSLSFEVKARIAERDQTQRLRWNAPNTVLHLMLLGLLNAHVTVCHELRGSVLVLTCDDAMTGCQVGSTVTSKPTQFSIAGYHFGQHRIAYLCGLSHEPTSYTDDLQLLFILLHVPGE